MLKMRLPLILLSSAVLALILGMALLAIINAQQPTQRDRQQSISGISTTLNQIAAIVKGDNSQWVQNSAATTELSSLIAIGDDQSEKLRNGASGFFSKAIHNAAIAVDADWMTLRDGLIAAQGRANVRANVELTSANEQVEKPLVQQAPPVIQPAKQKEAPNAQLVIDTEVGYLITFAANDFKLIEVRVTEGTRSEPLRALVGNISESWVRISGLSTSAPDDLAQSIQQQERYAKDLLNLTRSDTSNSLFGYDTTSLILAYVSQVSELKYPLNQLMASQLAVSQAEDKPQPVQSSQVQNTQAIIASDTSADNTFIIEVLDQLKVSIAELSLLAAGKVEQASRFLSFAMTCFLAALLLSVLAVWGMLRAASVGRIEHEATAIGTADTSDHEQRSSVNDAEMLLSDINALAAGDLRQSVRVPKHGYSKPIAESVNRSGAVMRNLVGMTRGVAARIAELANQYDSLGESLALKDIQRQSYTAELSDSINARSKLLNQQHDLLNNTELLLAGIGKKAEPKPAAVNNVSASLASVSAQVELSSGRMQRLLVTAANVTGSTAKLKQLAEQTRLQALNASLKMSEPESLSVAPSSGYYTDFPTNTDTVGLFDDVHHLTGKLVQIASDTDALISLLQKDIIETSEALNASKQEINNSAQHTYNATVESNELVGSVESLQIEVGKALANIIAQQAELATSAERIVALDKAGNAYSDFTVSITQDIVELQSMATKLDDSVAGFKLREEAALER